MSFGLIQVYSWARRWSNIGVAATLALVVFAEVITNEISLSVQLAIAVFALLVGIPHGAIDHLISIPSQPRSRFVAYLFIYTITAVLAGFLIATWEVNGFRAVLLMSALHFGFGDASYYNESQDADGKPRYNSLASISYALPAGFLPVILPLTDARSLSALERINPELVTWAGDSVSDFRSAVLVGTVTAVCVLILTKSYRMVVDLLLLLLLSLLAPPLIAFATYFGFWHALRHTARLVPKLPIAQNLAARGEWRSSIIKAVLPGVYAVLLALLVAIFAMIQFPDEFSSSLLWALLVVVWALTVPHMIATSRFDLKALARS